MEGAHTMDGYQRWFWVLFLCNFVVLLASLYMQEILKKEGSNDGLIFEQIFVVVGWSSRDDEKKKRRTAVAKEILSGKNILIK